MPLDLGANLRTEVSGDSEKDPIRPTLRPQKAAAPPTFSNTGQAGLHVPLTLTRQGFRFPVTLLFLEHLNPSEYPHL